MDASESPWPTTVGRCSASAKRRCRWMPNAGAQSLVSLWRKKLSRHPRGEHPLGSAAATAAIIDDQQVAY